MILKQEIFSLTILGFEYDIKHSNFVNASMDLKILQKSNEEISCLIAQNYKNPTCKQHEYSSSTNPNYCCNNSRLRR